jgi:hypothetical protein
MAKYLTLPDGSSFQMKEGQSPAEAMRVAQQLYPEAFGSAQPKQDTSGLKAAASAGLERLKGQTALTAAKLGFKDIAEAEAYQKQQEAKAAERFTPTEKGWTEDFGLKFRETLGGSLPYMAAPVAAGAAALAAPVSAPVAAGLGLLGAGAVSTGQFTGSNLARQMDEGRSLQDASLGKAVGAAVPQALLDTAAMALLPGVGKLFGSVGSKLTNEQAKAIASQTLGKTVADYAAKTGTAMGREGVTEATQQLLERLQAGLQIADPEARKEYIDSFIGGAVLGGAVAPVGRYVERSGAQTQAQEAQQARVREQRKIADEEAKVLAAEEEARKQTPEYALDVEQRYQAAEQQKANLKAQIKKGSKEAPLSEADKAFNTDINAQLKELQPTVKELGQEFNRTAKVREQAKEQQRVDALSPEEFMLEQTMVGEGIQAADRAKKEKGALFEREAAPAAPVDTSVADYAAGQLEAARNMGAIGLDDYVGFLMQDPTMADQMVKTRTKMPDLTRQENEAVLSALKLQLKAQEKAAVAETKTELQQRQADLQAQETTTDADPLAMLRESEAEVEQQRAEGETNFDYLNDMFGQAFENQQPGVSAPESLKVTPNAPTIRRTVEKLIADRDQAEQDRAAANQAGERAAARAAAERAEEAKTALNRVSKQVGDASPYAASFVETRNAQEKALFELEDVLDKIKRGVVLGGPATEEATTTRAALQAQADDLKKQYIRGVLQEAAIHRRAQGTPAISTDEAVKAASEIDTALEELIVRMQAAPRRESLQEVITKPAQVRGTEVVSPAETEMRDLRPLEERRFGAPAEAVKVIFDQLAGVRDALSNARGKARKIEAEPLTQQYAATEAKKVAEARGETATTLSGELRRRTEFVRNKMAKMVGMRPAARDVLNSAADVMDAGKATRELLDTVEPLVDAIVAKREVKQVDVRAVKDALSAISKQAQEGEVAGRIEGQAELFTERQDRARDDATIGVIRKNFANFEKSPPVMKARAAIEQAKKAAADAKVAQEKQAKKKVEKLVALTDAVEDQRRDLQQAITAAIETERGAFSAAAKLLDPPVVAAQKALDSAKKDLDALQAKVDAAPEFADKLKYVTQVADQRKALDAAQANLDKSIAESQATYDGATLVAAAHRDSLVRFERKALEKLEKRLDKLRSEVAAGGGDVTAIQKEAAAQRQRAAKAENDARVANEKADRDRRQLEQRLLSGLGLEGTKRVAGEVAAIKSDTDAAVDAERAEAQANRKRAEEALDKKQDVPQLARVTSPVTRDVTKPGRLEESRKPKQTNVAITEVEMQEANRISEEARLANEEAARLRGMSEKEKKAQAKEERALAKELAKLRSVYRVSTTAGKGTTPQRLAAIIEKMTSDWKNVPNIVMAETFDALPADLQAQAIADDVADFVPGMYNPNDNTVYLVAENLHSDADIYATVAHEITGHFGLRAMLGGEYTATMDSIYNGNADVREKANAKMERIPSLSRQTATEEVLADMAENAPAEPKGALRQLYDTIKKWFRETLGFDAMPDKAVKQIVENARKYVIEGTGGKPGEAPKATSLYRAKDPKYASDELADAGNVAGKVLAKQRTVTDVVKQEGLGMGLATRLVDRFAPLEKASKLMDSLKGTQMMYYARMFDQKMHFLSQAVSNGAIGLEKKTRADGRSEWLVESKEGASIKGVVDIVKDAKKLVGSAEGAEQLFSLYTVAKRAERVGLNKLNFGGAVTQADLDRAMKAITNTPGLAKIFEDARQEYNAFNKGMVQFAVDTGALRKEVAAKMLQSDDYVPFYRERDGGVEMVLGNETIAKIGNLKNQPYLKELVGGDERIIDFMTSSVQNANMLTDMALRNLSTKSAAFELRDIGMAKIGKGTASGTDVVNFKDGGEDYHAVIDTTGAGFPAELLVKGMEGIPYQTTWLTKGLGIPAKILRKAVTLNPAYAARQLFRDSLAAPLLSGANFTPIIGALKEINGTANKTLERRGITGGQVFTGTQEDMADTLRRLTAGESGWLQGLSKLEALSMEADALTRRAQYNSYIQQGLSEMEATYTALESMNFSKRGASPAMHFLSTVIPFFNAQIQGLNVLFKAFTGDMPFNEKLKVREKLLQRGAVLAGATMIYAALMQDDESYKNATPEQKYGNWFIHVPGLDEAVKLPIPFEIGYIFKALPEALVNMMAKEEGGEEALKAFKQIALQTIPGGSSYGLPQAIKPLIEVGLGKSFYTGRDLESAYEQSMVPGKRTRENTTDFARTVGDMFNVSPIKIDALIQGYTSSTGLAFVNALSFAIPTPPSPDKAALRASEIPLVGSLFQPKDAGGIINAAYERMNEAKQVKSTFDGLMEKGRTEEARAFLQENLEKFANAGLATNFTSTMQKLSQAERAVRASDASPETKRAQLDQIKQAKIKIAEAVREAGRTTPQ